MRLTLAWFVLIASSGLARATPESDALITEGVELRRKQHDAEALERFRRALGIEATPRARAQIGFAEQALGRWADAERDLTIAGEAADDAWIVKNRAAIDRGLAVVAEHLGTLELSGSPAGATVRVAGEARGVLPLAHGLRLPVGTAAVELAADGYAAAQRTVVIAPGKISREHVELARLDVPASPEPAPRTPRPHRPTLWIGGWSLLGVGAALAAGMGGGGGGLYQASAARWNADSCVGAGLTRVESCGTERDRALLGQRLEISGLVLGGALIAAGVGMLAADTVARRSGR